MKELPNFEIDPSALTLYEELCWICKNRNKCPLHWECETLENLDNDDTNNGVDKA